MKKEEMTQLFPGIYQTPQGAICVDVPEILTASGIEDTPANRREAAEKVKATVAALRPELKVSHHR